MDSGGKKQKENLILIGMPGVGKSTVGVIAAKVLGYRFLDTDLEIQETCGALLSQIISDRGVDGFIKVENEVLSHIQAQNTIIATGGSAVDAINSMKARNCKNIRLMNLVAAPEGIAVMQERHPDVDIYVAAVDECLNENAYIVPGLGDAGDRIFGTK